MGEDRKAVILLSGGLDSATTLAIANAEGYELYALSFDYGQRHKIELDASRRIADHYKVKKHLVINIDLWPEETIVANVSIMFFIVHIEIHGSLILRDIPIELTLIFVVTGTAFISPERAIGTIVFQIPVSEYLFRITIQQPVEQIEMMCGFVYPEGPSRFSQTVPSSEI